MLRRELDAERELRRRLELRLAELERRLSMDSSDSGTPSSKERIGAKEARRARQQSERERQEGPQAGRAARASGERAWQRDPDPDESKDAEPPAECRQLQGRPGRRGRPRARGGRRSSTWRSSGRRPSGRCRACVPVLRDGHVRGAAAGRARGLGVLRAGAERRRGGADRVRERAARAGRAGHGHAAGGAGLAGLGGQGQRPAGGAAGEGRVRRGDARGAGRGESAGRGRDPGERAGQDRPAARCAGGTRKKAGPGGEGEGRGRAPRTC